MPNPISPILEPYLLPNPHSLTLITSTLDATANWLILRFVYASLNTGKPNLYGGTSEDVQTNVQRGSSKVVFVSFLRSLEQWREMGKRISLDFPSLISQKRLLYIDGLFTSLAPSSRPSQQQEAGLYILPSHSLTDLESTLLVHLSTGSAPPTLMIDGLDFLLASRPGVTTLSITKLLGTLFHRTHSIILSVQADSPLLHNTWTPLEMQHRLLVTTLAHQARLVLQLRALGTGAARDVTGVVRVSKGGGVEREDEGGRDMAEVGEGGEWLYQVKGDGNVRVWARGG